MWTRFKAGQVTRQPGHSPVVDTLSIGGETCCTDYTVRVHPSDAPVLSGASDTDSAWLVLAPFRATMFLPFRVHINETECGKRR